MEELLNRGIKEIIEEYPAIGDILSEYKVGCVTCEGGVCLLRQIVAIHNLAPETERDILTRIAAVVWPGREVKIPVRKREQPAREAASASPPMKKLMDEHKLIKRWIALIPTVIPDLDLGSAETQQLVRAGLDFIRSFADKFHHAKEEEILFRYFDQTLEIITVMLEDHEKARAHVRAVNDALTSRDNDAARRHLAAYAELLTEHIKKEDEILYPWMDRQLSDAQVGRLFSEFAEADQRLAGVAERAEKFVREMEERPAKRGKGKEAKQEKTKEDNVGGKHKN